MIGLVVPTYNMAPHLPRLWRSVERSGLAGLLADVVFVDDASTDDTARVLQELAAHAPVLRVVRHPHNQGRFLARRTGAAAARAERLLFLDSRVELPEGFGAALAQVLAEHRHVVGVVELDVAHSVFSLYWQRTHEALWRRHHQAIRRGPVVLTPGNFDAHLKGTTILLTERAFFLHHCDVLGPGPVLNDDTALLRSMVAGAPLVIDPRLHIQWEPRQDARAFLAHLYARGPSFAEYHVFLSRGPFFLAVMAGLAGLGGLLVCAVVAPWVIPPVLAGVAAALLASAWWIAGNPVDALRILPLHVAAAVVFGVGVLRGLGVNLWRLWQGTLPRASWQQPEGGLP